MRLDFLRFRATGLLPLMVVSAATAFALLACESPTSPDQADIQALYEVGTGAPNEREHQRPKTANLKLMVESAAPQGAGVEYFKLPDMTELWKFPQDPQNPLSGAKITLGMYLFMDPAMAVNNVRPEGHETYSCGSCHPAQSAFFSNRPQGIGEGGSGFGTAGEGRVFLPQYDSNPDAPDVQAIRVPSIMNAAYQKILMWDGKLGGVGPNIGTESRWTPGTPLESNTLGMQGLETQAHGGMLAHRFLDIGTSSIPGNILYQAQFSQSFPGDPSPINRLNAAKAIAAFERIVVANRSPWQRWLRGDDNALTDAEVRGAIVFFGRGRCVTCHTGPALNSMTFYALGMNDLDGTYAPGMINLAPFGGTVPDDVRRGRGGFTGRAVDDYKFKTPQLYNLKESPYYGHGASFATVRDVVEYLNAGIPENPIVPAGQLADEFKPLGLTAQEISDLVAFVEDALYDPDVGELGRYLASFVPSGLCYPSNDPVSQSDLCGASPPPTLTSLLRSHPRPSKSF